MELQNSQVTLITEGRNYKTKTFKILGGIQIGLGVLCVILSIGGIVIDGINVNKRCTIDYSTFTYDFHKCHIVWDASRLLVFDIICLISSGWCILTGAFPFCMTENRKHNWRCLKITFMVLCIIGASVFIPTIFIISVIGTIIRDNDNDRTTALSGIQALIALTELVVAIVAASFSCCCSTWKTTNSFGRVLGSANQSRDVMNLTTVPLAADNTQRGVYPFSIVNEQQQAPNLSSLQPPAYKQ